MYLYFLLKLHTKNTVFASLICEAHNRCTTFSVFLTIFRDYEKSDDVITINFGISRISVKFCIRWMLNYWFAIKFEWLRPQKLVFKIPLFAYVQDGAVEPLVVIGEKTENCWILEGLICTHIQFVWVNVLCSVPKPP